MLFCQISASCFAGFFFWFFVSRQFPMFHIDTKETEKMFFACNERKKLLRNKFILPFAFFSFKLLTDCGLKTRQPAKDYSTIPSSSLWQIFKLFWVNKNKNAEEYPAVAAEKNCQIYGDPGPPPPHPTSSYSNSIPSNFFAPHPKQTERIHHGVCKIYRTDQKSNRLEAFA